MKGQLNFDFLGLNQTDSVVIANLCVSCDLSFIKNLRVSEDFVHIFRTLTVFLKVLCYLSYCQKYL